jgi:hypothetical protein
MFCTYPRKKTLNFFVYSTQRLVFITEETSVYCAVWTGSLNKIHYILPLLVKFTRSEPSNMTVSPVHVERPDSKSGLLFRQASCHGQYALVTAHSSSSTAHPHHGYHLWNFGQRNVLNWWILLKEAVKSSPHLAICGQVPSQLTTKEIAQSSLMTDCSFRRRFFTINRHNDGVKEFKNRRREMRAAYKSSLRFNPTRARYRKDSLWFVSRRYPLRIRAKESLRRTFTWFYQFI